MTLTGCVERLTFAASGMTQYVLRLTSGAIGITDCGDALAFGRIFHGWLCLGYDSLFQKKITSNIPDSGWLIRFLPVESSVVPNEVCSLMLLLRKHFT